DIAEVMTHRTEVAALPLTASLNDITNLSIETGYSRIAIYEDDIDNICGFAYIKDLLKFITEIDEKEFDLKTEMRKPIYLPESCSCSDAFAIFKKEKTQIGVVVDEYGGTYGIVTMEDLLETIFGNIQDEYDNEKVGFMDMGGGVYILDGDLSIPDVEQIFDTKFSDNFEYDTIGGLITEFLGRLPTSHEEAVKEITVGEISFKALDWDERRITKLEAMKLQERD
ncbi:MAG: hemolysin family protein, partial [Oscillospiraceae bacterium]